MRRSEAKRLRYAILMGSISLPDEIADKVPELFDSWQSGVYYTVGDRRQYEGLLYKCLISHTSQDDWTPDVAVSLWVRTDNPVEEWPEWKEPAGAHDSYALGAKVSHSGYHWISDYDGNNWEPGVFGWHQA